MTSDTSIETSLLCDFEAKLRAASYILILFMWTLKESFGMELLLYQTRFSLDVSDPRMKPEQKKNT